MSKVLLSDEDWVFLYAELASYVEEKLIGDKQIRDKDGQRLPEFDEPFCEICDDIESIMDVVFEKETGR